eukprot:XP_001707875.1 Hypothetical protein GL50803_35174 [Giardia lamblia ATCC 50803]
MRSLLLLQHSGYVVEKVLAFAEFAGAQSISFIVSSHQFSLVETDRVSNPSALGNQFLSQFFKMLLLLRQRLLMLRASFIYFFLELADCILGLLCSFL